MLFWHPSCLFNSNIALKRFSCKREKKVLLTITFHMLFCSQSVVLTSFCLVQFPHSAETIQREKKVWKGAVLQDLKIDPREISRLAQTAVSSWLFNPLYFLTVFLYSISLQYFYSQYFSSQYFSSQYFSTEDLKIGASRCFFLLFNPATGLQLASLRGH